MVGAGTASSPSPNAAAPINTVGITNNDIKVTTNAEKITATRRRVEIWVLEDNQVNAGSDFTICKCDGTTRLNGKFTGDPNACVGGLKYKWVATPIDSVLLKNDTLLSPNICPKEKTKYKLTIDGNNDE
ncbi:hypothetical protein DI09_538p10, partial [Mitosporidium daphniae]